MTFYDVMKLKNNLLIGQKTMWEKDKLLVKSNFPFSHNVFQDLLQQTGLMLLLFGNGLKQSRFELYNELWGITFTVNMTFGRNHCKGFLLLPSDS